MSKNRPWYPKFVSDRRKYTEQRVIEFMSKNPRKIWQVAKLEKEMLRTLEEIVLARMLDCIPQVLATMHNMRENPPARWKGVRMLRVERGRYRLDILPQPKLTGLDTPAKAPLGSLKKCPMAMQMQCQDCRLFIEGFNPLGIPKEGGPDKACTFETQARLAEFTYYNILALREAWK